MRFNLRTRPMHCQIWALTIDMLAPQIFRAYSEFAWHTNPYCPLELQILYTWHILLQILIVCKFDDKFRISYRICGNRILYLNITIALRTHLRDVQIRRRLPCIRRESLFVITCEYVWVRAPVAGESFVFWIGSQTTVSALSFWWVMTIIVSEP